MCVPRDLFDDPSVPDVELLYRGIHPQHLKEGPAVSSAAFMSKANPHVSVDLGSLCTPRETYQRRAGDAGVVQLVTGDVRKLTPGVARDPTEDNPAHALLIHDFTLTNSKWKEVARRLAKACVWAIGPATHSLE